MKFLKALYFVPGNLFADALGATGEHERGLLRSLANSVIWITVAATVFMIAATFAGHASGGA